MAEGRTRRISVGKLPGKTILAGTLFWMMFLLVVPKAKQGVEDGHRL